MMVVVVVVVVVVNMVVTLIVQEVYATNQLQDISFCHDSSRKNQYTHIIVMS